MNKKLLTTLLLCIFTIEPLCWAEEVIIGADGQARYANQETPVIKKEQLNLEKAKMSNSNKEPLNTTTNQTAMASTMDAILDKIEKTQGEDWYLTAKSKDEQFQTIIRKEYTCTFKKSDILSLNSSNSNQFYKVTSADGSYRLVPSTNKAVKIVSRYDRNDKLIGLVKIKEELVSGCYYTFFFSYEVTSQDDLTGTLKKVEITNPNSSQCYAYTANGKLTAVFLNNQLYSLRNSEVYYRNLNSGNTDKLTKEDFLNDKDKNSNKNIQTSINTNNEKSKTSKQELQTAETITANKSYNQDYGTRILDKIKATEDSSSYLLATELDKKYKSTISKTPKTCMFEKSDNVLLRKGRKDLMLKAYLADGDYVLWLPTNETKQIATEYHSDGTVMGYVKTDLNNSSNVYYEYRVKSKNDLNGTLKHIMFCDRTNKTIFIYTAEGKLRSALFKNALYHCDNLDIPTLSSTARFYSDNRTIHDKVNDFGNDYFCTSIDGDDILTLAAYTGPLVFAIVPLMFVGAAVTGVFSLITLPFSGTQKDKHKFDNQIIDDFNHDEYKSKH